MGDRIRQQTCQAVRHTSTICVACLEDLRQGEALAGGCLMRSLTYKCFPKFAWACLFAFWGLNRMHRAFRSRYKCQPVTGGCLIWFWSLCLPKWQPRALRHVLAATLFEQAMFRRNGHAAK